MISVLVFLEDEDPVEKISGSVAHVSEGITVKDFRNFPKTKQQQKNLYRSIKSFLRRKSL